MNPEGPITIEYNIISSNSQKRSCPIIVNENKKIKINCELEELIEQEWPSEPTYLQALNSHPFDWRVRFNPELHIYYVFYDQEGKHISNFNLSASTWAKQYFSKFDDDKIIDSMMKSLKWNTNQNKYKGMTKQQIKDKWKEDNDKGSRKGTFYHLLLENHCNGYDLTKYAHLIPIQQYLQWRKEFFDPQFIEFRTEIRFHSSIDLRIVGTADLIAIRKNHPLPQDCNGCLTLSIFDWKNTKDLKMKDDFGNKFGIGPCAGVVDCNYGHYCIQQNIYKWLLTRFYNIWTYNGHKYTSVKVEMMKLIIIHENNKDNKVQEVDVPDMSDIIEKMVIERRKDLKKAIEQDLLKNKI